MRSRRNDLQKKNTSVRLKKKNTPVAGGVGHDVSSRRKAGVVACLLVGACNRVVAHVHWPREKLLELLRHLRQVAVVLPQEEKKKRVVVSGVGGACMQSGRVCLLVRLY